MTLARCTRPSLSLSFLIQKHFSTETLSALLLSPLRSLGSAGWDGAPGVAATWWRLHSATKWPPRSPRGLGLGVWMGLTSVTLPGPPVPLQEGETVCPRLEQKGESRILGCGPGAASDLLGDLGPVHSPLCACVPPTSDQHRGFLQGLCPPSLCWVQGYITLIIHNVIRLLLCVVCRVNNNKGGNDNNNSNCSLTVSVYSRPGLVLSLGCVCQLIY